MKILKLKIVTNLLDYSKKNNEGEEVAYINIDNLLYVLVMGDFCMIILGDDEALLRTTLEWEGLLSQINTTNTRKISKRDIKRIRS